jgi:hypothetical protein
MELMRRIAPGRLKFSEKLLLKNDTFFAGLGIEASEKIADLDKTAKVIN